MKRNETQKDIEGTLVGILGVVASVLPYLYLWMKHSKRYSEEERK